MKMPSGVSIIIPVLNREHFLRDAVESVLATKYEPLELVIIDDGSTDGSLSLAKRLAGDYAGHIKVLTHQHGGNRGPSASRNLGGLAVLV